MISRSLEIMYPPFNIQIVVIAFLLDFSQNLPGCYPVAREQFSHTSFPRLFKRTMTLKFMFVEPTLHAKTTTSP